MRFLKRAIPKVFLISVLVTSLQGCAIGNALKASSPNQSKTAVKDDHYVIDRNGVDILKLDNNEYALGDFYHSALGQRCRKAKAIEQSIKQDLVMCMNEGNTYFLDSVLIKYIANK